MSFKVNPDGVCEFQSTIGALAGDANSAVKYVQQWTNVGYSEGRMFLSVASCATNAREQLSLLYSTLGTLASASAQELGKAARYYEITDVAVADRLDRTY